MRRMLCFAALAVSLIAGAADAGTATATGTASVAQTKTTNIAGPPNSQQTTFVSYGPGPYSYQLHPFTVDQSGIYTATSATTGVVNTTWILNGLFAPDPVAPTTPLSAYIVAVLSLTGPSPFTGTITGVNLTAGTQYTALVAYNFGSTPGVSSNTFTISGPGCIQIGGQVCAPVAIPTMSEWAMILLGVLLAGGAALTIQRRRAA